MNIPKLRFPEFQDALEWEEKRLGDISDVRDGTHDSPKFYSKGKPLITSKNLGEDGLLDRDNVSLICEEDYDKFSKRSGVKIGDILFGMIGTIGNPVLLQSEGFAIKNVALIKQKQELLNIYLLQLLNSRYIAEKFNVLNTGNSQKFIALGQIRNLEIPLPELLEQQKIANCLSSLEEVITAQSQKLEGLKTHKKGLMQQLFPAEGESVPKLRFLEFGDAGDWEEKKLGIISEIVRGGSPRPIEDFITSDVKGLHWLKIGDVNPESKYITQTRERVIKAALTKTRVVSPGDLILSNSMSFGRPYILKIESCIHDGWIAVTNISIEVITDYLYYLISSDSCQNYFVDNAAGAVVQNLNADIIKKLPVLIPSLLEQQKIADCLSSLEELIAAQTQKLETLKTFKKGLMQQLFPAPDDLENATEQP